MILSDFLSRQKTDDSNSHEIILISFNMREVLQEKDYNLYNMRIDDKYLVQTRSQMKSSGMKLPEVHGIEKGLDLHIQPGRQKLVRPLMNIRPSISKPRNEQGRAGIRRKARIVPLLQTPAPEVTQSLPETVTQSQETVQTKCKSTAQRDIRQPIDPTPFYPNPILRLPPRPPDLKENRRDLSD